MNIKDIARISGVGISTVSRVVNNHPDVKKETREHILNVIKQYNYIPNNSARVLKQSSTKNIGILIKGVFNPFLSEMITIISNKIQKMGYMMILQHTEVQDNDIDSVISFVKEKKLQGVICLGGNFLDITEESFNNIEATIVVTAVNLNPRLIGDRTFSSVGIDDEKAGYIATKHLIDKGHVDIGIMLCDVEEIASVARYAGYKKAHDEAGLEINKKNILEGAYQVDKAYLETKSYLEKEKPTAIFAVSDTMAMGVAKAISDSGYKIGEEISVIGFDGMDIAKYYTPTITTIEQPRKAMAEMSVELLFDVLSGKKENEHRILDIKLIEGQSCAEIK